MNRIDNRELLNQVFPRWMQPALTWISGKALPGAKPVFPLLCTPAGKILAVALTIGLGVALGLHSVIILV